MSALEDTQPMSQVDLGPAPGGSSPGQALGVDGTPT